MQGTVLAGRYRLLSKLGEGGMGSVWRAQHVTLGTPLAVKLIDSSIAHAPEALARFKREAQSAAELRSAHVVHIIDYGVEDNTPYIAMELLEGESLATRLEREGRLPAAEVADMLVQVARALTRAHAAGIVHRDLKPENIFLVPEGDDEIVKVLDFGIAKKLHALSDSCGVKTGAGTLLGTPYYMSPEQALGRVDIDQRADIWALGVLGFQCITGLRPFDGETLGALLMSICNDAIPVASVTADVPPGFDAWFARAAARNPEERFESAAQAASALRQICGPHSGRKSKRPSRGAGSQVVAPSEPVRARTLAQAANLAKTGSPSSITIPGLKRGHFRVRHLGVAAVLLSAMGAVAFGWGLLGRGNKAPPVIAARAELTPALAPTASINPHVAVSLVSPQPSAVVETPSDSAPTGQRLQTGTTAKIAIPLRSKRRGASPRGDTLPKPESAEKPAVPRNYDKSVGF